MKILLKILILFLITEITLRVVKLDSLEFYKLQKNYHKLDSEYFVDLEENASEFVRHFDKTYTMKFTTNEKGFRASRKVDNSKNQILCIGDSVAMGFGVDDEFTFCKKLDQFKDRNGNEYQSLNLAVDAYGPTQIHLKLKKHIKDLNPKLIYYFPSRGDDIDEEKFFDKKKSSEDDLILDYNKKRLIFEIQFQLSKYSYTFLAFKIFQENLAYRFNETFIWNYKKFVKFLECRNNSSAECEEFQLSSYSFKNEFFVPPKRDKNAAPTFPKEICTKKPEYFDLPESVISSTKKIIELANENKAKIVFVLAPVDFETAYCSQRDKYYFSYSYHHSLMKFLEKEKIEFVDLNNFTKSMLDGDNNYNVRPYYIIGDGHYTEKGNEWVYQILRHKTAEILPLEK